MIAYPLAAGFAAALFLTVLLTPVVIYFARAMGWVAHPRADRWHQQPTALMGGIAIFLAAVAGLYFSGGLTAQYNFGEGKLSTLPLWAGAAAMFALGVVDDRIGMRPHVKLVGQIAAACWMVLHDIRFEAVPYAWALPLTVFWLIGITNAVNLLDNMDGLAAGVVGIAALIAAAYGWLDGNVVVRQLALPVAGASLGFLFFNFKPAKIFMGDCGSMFLGFGLAGTALVGTNHTAPNVALSLFVPVTVLAVPIFDTTLVTIARRLAGRPVSEGGRDHSSHRLVALGLSERDSVLVFYVLTALFGGLALASTRLPLPVTAVVAVLLFLALAGAGVFLGTIQVHPPASRPSPRATVLGGMLMYKKQLAQVMLDALLIPVACLAAYLLRFDGNIPPRFLQAVIQTLPFLMAIKLMALAMMRAYRGVWRYAGMADVLAVAAGSTVGSLVAGLMIGLVNGFYNLSRGAFILDWLLFTNLAIAARTGLMALRHVFARLPRPDAARVLIVGAGRVGMAAANELMDPQAAQAAAVVGFVDDDPTKHHRTLNGYPVLGSLSELPAIVAEEQVDSCVLALSPASPLAQQARELCEGQGIPYVWAAAANLRARLPLRAGETAGVD